MFQGEVEDGPAALRGADQVRALELEVAHEVPQVTARGKREREVLRFAEPSLVVADDAEPVRERCELVVPHAAVGDGGVDKHHVRSLAEDFIVEPGAVALGVAFLYVFCHQLTPLSFQPTRIPDSRNQNRVGRPLVPGHGSAPKIVTAEIKPAISHRFFVSCPPLCPLCLCGKFRQDSQKKPPYPLPDMAVVFRLKRSLRDRGDREIVHVERAFSVERLDIHRDLIELVRLIVAAGQLHPLAGIGRDRFGDLGPVIGAGGGRLHRQLHRAHRAVFGDVEPAVERVGAFLGQQRGDVQFGGRARSASGRIP